MLRVGNRSDRRKLVETDSRPRSAVKAERRVRSLGWHRLLLYPGPVCCQASEHQLMCPPTTPPPPPPTHTHNNSRTRTHPLLVLNACDGLVTHSSIGIYPSSFIPSVPHVHKCRTAKQLASSRTILFDHCVCASSCCAQFLLRLCG